jgi:hypothetical protein
MMRRSPAAFVAVFASLSGMAVHRWRSALPALVDPSSNPPMLAPRRLEATDSVLDAAEDDLVSNDPFRLSNTPADVRFDPSVEAAAGVVTAPTLRVRPVMTLKAIVGGPPWQAIVDGIPGQPAGAVLRQGNAAGIFSIRRVTRDSVVIQGPDTIWVLGFGRRP